MKNDLPRGLAVVILITFLPALWFEACTALGVWRDRIEDRQAADFERRRASCERAPNHYYLPGERGGFWGCRYVPPEAP